MALLTEKWKIWLVQSFSPLPDPINRQRKDYKHKNTDATRCAFVLCLSSDTLLILSISLNKHDHFYTQLELY